MIIAQQLPRRLSLKKPGHIELIFCLCLFLLIQCVPVFAQMEGLRDLYEKAVNAYNKQQYAQAIEFYGQIIKTVPTFAPAYNGMALANQAASGDENKTIEYLKKAISYDPKLALAYDNLGRIYYSRQDVDNAEIYFKKALMVDPTISSSQLCLAWINLLVRSKPVTAIKYFKMVLKTTKDSKIYYGLGQAYFASNQRSEAMDMITKLYELGEDELAGRLEKSLRENSVVNTSVDTGLGNPSQPPPGLGPLAPTPDKPTGTKVHLRGKLSDY